MCNMLTRIISLVQQVDARGRFTRHWEYAVDVRMYLAISRMTASRTKSTGQQTSLVASTKPEAIRMEQCADISSTRLTRIRY
jgi:hypothetical protein